LKGPGAGGAPAKSFGEALKLAISANLGWGFELFDFVVYLSLPLRRHCDGSALLSLVI